VADYRCYLLDDSGLIQAAQDLVAEADKAAIAIARERFPSAPFEVWSGPRRVFCSPDSGQADGIAVTPK
jgi:hypothetical protein